MTTIDYTAPAASTRPALLDAARAVFEAPTLFLKRRFIAARTRSELSQLSDQQLDDIGVIRADIDRISTDMAIRTYL